MTRADRDTLALIERIEKATGPDRQLDRMIEETLPGVERHIYADMVKDGYVISGQGHPTFGAGQAYLPPNYTGSIDKALTLVPEGHRWQLRNSEEKTFGFFVAVWGASGSGVATWDQHGATPALALCIAALRARLPKENPHD